MRNPTDKEWSDYVCATFDERMAQQRLEEWIAKSRMLERIMPDARLDFPTGHWMREVRKGQVQQCGLLEDVQFAALHKYLSEVRETAKNRSVMTDALRTACEQPEHAVLTPTGEWIDAREMSKKNAMRKQEKN